MDLEQLREKTLGLLKAEGAKGSLLMSDHDLCNLVGETDYANLYTVLTSLRDEGLIFFYHAPNGTNQIELMG
jgi:hypothetical protein